MATSVRAEFAKAAHRTHHTERGGRESERDTQPGTYIRGRCARWAACSRRSYRRVLADPIHPDCLAAGATVLGDSSKRVPAMRLPSARKAVRSYRPHIRIRRQCTNEIRRSAAQPEVPRGHGTPVNLQANKHWRGSAEQTHPFSSQRWENTRAP